MYNKTTHTHTHASAEAVKIQTKGAKRERALEFSNRMHHHHHHQSGNSRRTNELHICQTEYVVHTTH